VDDAHSVLDLGAGTGNGVVELLRHRRTREILAIEKNATMLDHLRRKLDVEDLVDCSVTTLKGDIISCLAKEVGEEYFDAAIMINVLYALDDPAEALAQVARTMKRGGTLALSTPTKETDVGKLFAAIEREIASQGELEALRSNIEDARARHDAMDSSIHRDSTDDIVRYVNEAGFQIVELLPNQYVEAVVVIKAVRL
jgi:ubiquinone/menaquinone biosynthesis C-methylase UbiE